jgi:hypothetical protein
LSGRPVAFTVDGPAPVAELPEVNTVRLVYVMQTPDFIGA